MTLTNTLQLLAIPAVILVAIAAAYVAGATPRGVRAIGGWGLAGGLAASAWTFSATLNGRIEISLGQIVPGIPIVLRADSLTLIVIALAAVAAAALLAVPARPPMEYVAILLALLGTVLAGLAGNGFLLFGGVEIANVGVLMTLACGARRAGRASVAVFLIQHGAALALLAATVQLQVRVGTTDFSAIPPGSLLDAPALLWIGAVIVSLAIPSLLPSTLDSRRRVAVIGVAMAPSGIFELMRFVDAVGNASIPDGVRFLAGAAGLAAGLGGAAGVCRWARQPVAATRALPIALAGPVLTVATLPDQGNARTALAFAALALQLALVLAPVWLSPARLRFPALAPLAFGLAAGMPLGLGAVATVVEASILSSAGPGLVVPLIGTVLAAVLLVGGGMRGARSLFSRLPGSERRRSATTGLAVVAVLVAVGSGVLPTIVSAVVGGPPGLDSVIVDAATIRVPGGGWAGGYLLMPAVLLTAGIVAGMFLSGAPVSFRPSAPPANCAIVNPAGFLSVTTLRRGYRRTYRRVSPVLAVGGGRIDAIDRWLTTQPRLPLIVGAAGLAILVWR